MPEAEADQIADWEKNKIRIIEYLESFGLQERLEVEIAALGRHRLDEDRFRHGSGKA